MFWKWNNILDEIYRDKIPEVTKLIDWPSKFSSLGTIIIWLWIACSGVPLKGQMWLYKYFKQHCTTFFSLRNSWRDRVLYMSLSHRLFLLVVLWLVLPFASSVLILDKKIRLSLLEVVSLRFSTASYMMNRYFSKYHILLQ